MIAAPQNRSPRIKRFVAATRLWFIRLTSPTNTIMSGRNGDYWRYERRVLGLWWFKETERQKLSPTVHEWTERWGVRTGDRHAVSQCGWSLMIGRMTRQWLDGKGDK